MAVYKRDIVDINLETGNIHRSFLKHSIGYLDQKADHFGIRAFRNGEPVNLTGVSVQGVFMPPQGSPIAITSGNIVNFNEAEVVLPQACYNYDGQFTLAIKLVDPSNAVTGTMRIVDGMVDNTHASGTVAPVAAIPSYQEVLSTYEQAIAAINKTVRFDAVQSLTDTQKATARGNISAPSVADLQAETTAREAADTAINNALDVIGEKVPNLYNADGVILGKNWAGEDAADRAYIQIPVTAGMTYTIIVPTNANIPQVAVVQLNSVPASLDSFYVTGGDRETFTAVTNCVSIRIQFEGSTTLSAANFENYNVYVFEGTEEYFSAVDKIARSKLPERKYIFIGDSYCEGYNPDGNVTGWGERLKTAMGLNNSNCIISYKGGTGFYHVSDGKTFSTLLDEAGTGIDKNAITDIVVCGGWNDNTESVTNVYFNGVLPFATKVTNEYPNAILYVGMIGASNNADVRLRLQSVVLYAYQYGALRANYRYLNYVENALSESDLATDGIHPNEDGQVAITIAIKQALTTGSSGTKKIDATLSQSGVAADAQATGNAVGNEATARQNADALKVNISDIENDLTGTTAGKVLDARQGKVLDDKITAEAATRAAADSDLKSALNTLRSEVVFASYDADDFEKTYNKYVNGSGAIIDAPAQVSGYFYEVMAVEDGDVVEISVPSFYTTAHGILTLWDDGVCESVIQKGTGSAFTRTVILNQSGQLYFSGNDNYPIGFTLTKRNGSQLNKIKNSVGMFDYKSKDYFDYDANTYINNNGEVKTAGSGANYRCYKIPANKNDYIYARADGLSTAVSMLSLWKNGTYQKTICLGASELVEYAYIVEENNCEVRFSARTSQVCDLNVYLCDRETFVPTEKVILDDTSKLYITDKDEYTAQVTAGKYVSVVGKGKESSVSFASVTGYIETNSITAIKTSLSSVLAICYYDIGKNYISGIVGTDGESPSWRELNPPEGAAFIRISNDTRYNTAGIIIRNSLKQSVEDAVPYNAVTNLLDKINSEIADKAYSNVLAMYDDIICIGDSLTWSQVYIGSGVSDQRQAYKPYPDILASMCGATGHLFATPGDSCKTWWTRSSTGAFDTHGLYIVFLGTNSGMTDTIDTDCVGTDPDDFANTKTGQYGRILQTIKNNNDRAVLILPYNGGNDSTPGEETTLEETQETIEKFGTKYSFPVISVDEPDRTNAYYHYYPDKSGGNNLHFNDLGYEWLASTINKQINLLPVEEKWNIMRIQ